MKKEKKKESAKKKKRERKHREGTRIDRPKVRRRAGLSCSLLFFCLFTRARPTRPLPTGLLVAQGNRA